jgi:methionine-gamma-lyase
MNSNQMPWKQSQYGCNEKEHPMRLTPPSLATRAIHHGYDARDHQGALNPPVYLSSTFTFDTAEAGGAMFAGAAEGHFYSRISNPTLDALETHFGHSDFGLYAVVEQGGSIAVGQSWSLL